MTDARRVVSIVGCATGGIETLRAGFVHPAQARGWRVAITLTPTAAGWLQHTGELAHLERTTDLPVRVHARMPGEMSPHPTPACLVVAPASANTVAKLALGIADNQALTASVGTIGQAIPVIVFPRINAAHARHPAWTSHIDALTGVGVRVVHGEDVWPLYEPGEAPSDRPLPWSQILALVESAAPR